ncbi:MAG: hypothetical protein ABWZ15_04955 [Acidimicrobiia bacterium]
MRPRALFGVVVVALLLAGCDSGSDDDATSERARDLASEEEAAVVDAFAAQQDAYLDFATETPLDPGSPLSVVAHAEQAARDTSFAFDPSIVTPDAYADMFADIDAFEDTTDFDLLYLINMWLGYGDQLPQETRDAIEQRFLAFKYWYTEPTPEGIVDNKYYWSENHRIIFHTLEYLAGHEFSDATFTNDGRTGAEHAETAETRIRDWLDEKVRFGFSEWHSNVYYQKDVTPLLTLVEFAPDEDLANRAAMVLDLVLLDIALHLQRGTFGATHGRSYMKDKSTALDEDTFALAKILFDDTSEPYQSPTDAGATLLARAQKYRMPEVIRVIATSDAPMTDVEHMNVPLDALAPVTPNPEPPYGIAFDDPENVPFWWERGAQTAWQTVPITLQTLDQYGLWDSQFYSPFKPLADAVGGDAVAAQNLAQSLAPMLTFGLLTEVHTYTHRTGEVMLSTAQDYRPGVFGDQYHAWQATFDERALVFTTHPKNEPETGSEWPDRDGYWTGSGSIPRSAQHGAAGIHVYSPQFEPAGPPLDQFGYLDYTHAYFPQEHFDEVVTAGPWTFGRKGDGFIGLWSMRPTRWREHDPAQVFTHGLTQPFDLVADGGADNVWVVQVGDTTTFESFADFQAQLSAAPPTATPDLSVEFTSPTEGAMTFGWTGPLRIDGADVDLHPEARMSNPFVEVPFEGTMYEIRAGDDSLTLDFNTWTREIPD